MSVAGRGCRFGRGVEVSGGGGRFPELRRRFRLFELAGGGMLVVIGLLLVTGLWDSLLDQLRVWAGSVNLSM
jgi:cytochrome c-type biogenesis protein